MALPAVDGGLWGPLLEKTFAKSMGTYQQINAGFSPEALDYLTGAPTDVIGLEDTKEGTDKAWNHIS